MQFAPIAGRLNYPGHTLTLIVKGAFDLKPGHRAEPADEQLYPTGDEYYPDDDEMTGGCRYETDFAHYKPKADLLLVGTCHASGGNPVKACRVTFRVGTATSALYVFGDRQWKGLPGMRVISDPEPFTTMELRYENSFGGSNYKKNPVGKGFKEEDSETGENSWALPNIEDPEHLIDSPGSRPEPVGYGPLGRMWQQRFSKMGTYREKWLNERWPWFPTDFDMGYFNAAPPRMQVEGYLRGDESLFFENLHPEHSRYESQLPGIRVRCFLNRLTGSDAGETEFKEVAMHLDTLWVDMDAEKLALVWRGFSVVKSEDYEEIEHVFIMEEPVGSQPESLEGCHAMFLAARAEAGEEWAIEPEEPPAPEEEPAPEAPGVEIPSLKAAAAAGIGVMEGVKLTEAERPEAEKITAEGREAEGLKAEGMEAETEGIEAEKIDPETVKAQAKKFLAQAGMDLDSMPLEVREKAEQEMNRMVNKITETDPEKILAMEREELETQLTNAMSQAGLDSNNLPPISEKARQEQQRFFKEMGVDEEVDLSQDEDLERSWSILSAILPKIGMDPEDLSPLIQEAKKIKERAERDMAKPEEEKE